MSKERKDETHYLYYAAAALTYLGAMVSSNWALKWVPYPMQVVGKSAKPIPVMILGVLIGRKSYSIQRYVFVLVIVVGVVLFMLKDGKGSSSDSHSFGLGEILLIISLLCDGLTAAVQERMRRSNSPTAKHMMFSMNAWSSLFAIIAVLPTGEVWAFVPFIQRHPEVLYKMALLALTGSLGQFFIFVMVSSFGPLPCSIATTTRKFFTVLFSVIWFQNTLGYKQWIGCALVFIGLFADAIFGKNRKKPKAIEETADQETAAAAAADDDVESNGNIGKNDDGENYTKIYGDLAALENDLDAVANVTSTECSVKINGVDTIDKNLAIHGNGTVHATVENEVNVNESVEVVKTLPTVGQYVIAPSNSVAKTIEINETSTDNVQTATDAAPIDIKVDVTVTNEQSTLTDDKAKSNEEKSSANIPHM